MARNMNKIVFGMLFVGLPHHVPWKKKGKRENPNTKHEKNTHTAWPKTRQNKQNELKNVRKTNTNKKQSNKHQTQSINKNEKRKTTPRQAIKTEKSNQPTCQGADHEHAGPQTPPDPLHPQLGEYLLRALPTLAHLQFMRRWLRKSDDERREAAVGGGGSGGGMRCVSSFCLNYNLSHSLKKKKTAKLGYSCY